MPRISTFDPSRLQKLLRDKKIASLPELKRSLDTSSTMSVYRALKELGYRSSYSHRGKYYTVEEIAEFDSLGLWSHGDVWFSRFGNLVETTKQLVDDSEAGFSGEELETIVHVDPKQALLKLTRDRRIYREKMDDRYVYFSIEPATRKRQVLRRRDQQVKTRAGEIGRLSDELKAAVILFYSLLDEKQRRLYAGLESQRLGHGGDSAVAEFLDMDVHTVAKGRRELFSGEVDAARVRRRGGGAKAAEKKRRT